MSKTIKKYLMFILLIFMLTFVGVGLCVAEVAKADVVSEIALLDGAFVRADSEETSGLKFVARINKSYYDGLETANASADIKAGMIIVPDDFVTAAEGYTFNALSTLGRDIAYKDADTFKTVDGEYEFAGTLSEILSSNYTRKFTSIVYIKSSVEIAGFTEYDGNWYKYATNDTCKGKTIYYIARTAYEESADNRTAVVKSFIDGVAHIKNVEGTLSIGNNTEQYTSPFALESVKQGYVFSASSELKGIVYEKDGQLLRKTDINSIEDGVNIASREVARAVKNVDGTFTLNGKYPPNANPGTLKDSSVSGVLGYVAYKGNYGLGYYTDFYFEGNNMPIVVLFADNVNADLSVNGGKGIVLLNGLLSKNSESSHNFPSIFKISKMNRIEGSGISPFNTTSNTISALASFAQSQLQETVSYKYSVGSFEKDGKITLSLTLYNMDLKTTLQSVSVDTGISKTEIVGKNILAVAALKGEDANEVGYKTTFEASVPYFENGMGNASKNADGSLTLAGYYPSGISSANFNSSTGWMPGYYLKDEIVGLNTFVDIEFEGKNLPYVTFFANKDNTDLGGLDAANGITMINGLVNAGGENRTNRINIYGPNRYGIKNGQNAYVVDSRNPYAGFSDLARLAQDNLVEGTKYKLTIGTTEKEGNIYIVFSLYSGESYSALCENVEINTTITVATMKTELGISETEPLTGYIMYHGCMKGTDGSTPYATTFKLSSTYVK